MVDKKRGFTLIEVLISVGIIATVAMGAFAVSASARSMAVSSAANRFDSLLEAARTLARESSNGATIAFTPDAYGDGFVARLYRNRPGTDPLVVTTTPALEARVSVAETETLGTPAFALTLHASGIIAGITGNVLTGTAAPETPCPAAGWYHIVLSHAGEHMDRYITCRFPLAATGPVALASIIPATPQPLPTASSCANATCGTLPVIPKTSVTCPPRFIISGSATCENPPLVVSPSVLRFQRAGSPPSLAFTVHENIYTGAFHVADNCGGAVRYSIVSGGGNGTTSTYDVVALRGGRCTIFVSDDRNSLPQSIDVGIGNLGLIQQIVCDPISPPRPYGSDLGPNPDGIHEDLSSGTSCSVLQTPKPTSSAAPTSTPGPQINVTEIETVTDCDAGAAGSFFDLYFDSPDRTMAQVATWVAGGAKRVAQPDPALFDPATVVTAIVDERHLAPASEQCVL